MKVAVIDDLEEDYRRIEIYLNKYCKQHCINMPVFVQFHQNEEDFLKKFKADDYDFIFIDYYLNTWTGLELAKEIRKVDSLVVLIFITISRDFAIESYKVKASGYLVKPIVYEDFEEIMSLIDYEKIRNSSFIEICNGEDYIRVLVKDIIYCDINGHYIRVHMVNNQIYKCRTTFATLADKLLPYKEFLHCYKGCVINMKQIKEAGELVFLMSSGERIPFRKKEKSEILKIYHDFLFQEVRRRI